MTLLTKLDDELEEAAAKSRAARARKLQKLQRTPGVLRGVRGNFLDFEGPNGPLDPQNLQDKVTTELPLGSVEPQLDQVRFSVDYILVLDSSDKQIAFGPAAKIKATYPRLVFQAFNAFLATHLLETRNERDVSTPNLFTGTNGVAPKFPVPGAKDMYGVFQAFNLTGPRAIMGHTVWATEDEYVRMNKDGTVIGHCPASNSYLGSGDFKTPFIAAQKGIKWTICNDMGGGNYYNMLKVRFLCPPRPKKKSWMGVWRGVWEEGHARTEGGRYWCRSARLMGHRKE